MRTVAAQIDTELGKEGIFVIDLIDFDFGGGNLFCWAESKVDGTITFNGKLYEPRLLRDGLGRLPFTVGAKDDSTTAEFDNTDLKFTTLANQGVNLQHGRMKVHRLFHNLAPPNNAVQNYWHGRVLNFILTEATCRFELTFGFPELSQRALRRFEHSCNNLFADDEQCPYNHLAGFGIPENRLSGLATGGSATTLIDKSENFVMAGIQVGWHVFVKSKRLRGVITNVAATVLTVDQWRNVPATASGDSYIVGPAFTSCNFSKKDCIARGMYGPNRTQGVTDLNVSQRRYFVGNTRPAAVTFRGAEKNAQGKDKRFERTASGNDSIDGKVVPIIFGQFKVRDLIVLGSAAAGDFLHTLFTGGEGRVYSIWSPLVDGFPVDNPSFSGQLFREETFFTWGTDSDPNANDSGSELSLDQQKQAIGSRASIAHRRRSSVNTLIDHPYLFNDSVGDGISPSGLNMLRIRTEPEGGAREDAIPSGSAVFIGLMTKMPPGATPQADDLNTTSYTKYPNHIQVFYNMATNKRWGAGLDDASLDLTAVNSESDYCQEPIASSQSQFSKVTGTVSFSTTEPSTPRSNNWVFIGQDLLGLPLVGGIFRLTQSGKEFAANIIDIEEVPYLYDPYDWFDEFDVPSSEVGVAGVFVFIDRDWPAGGEPVAGDSYEIQPILHVRRFKAAGMLEEDLDVDEMLEAILQNCAGTFIQDQGKIAPVIRKAVDLSAAAALPIFTDKGSKRNVVRNADGSSTMKFTPDPIVSSIAVSYVDAGQDFRKTTLLIKNQLAEELIGKLFGEKRRDKRERTLSLNLTTSKDQAARIGSLFLRERGPLPAGRPNGDVEWVSPIHDAIKLQPIKDVRAVSSDHLPSYIQFVRIMELEENPDKMTMTVRARPHYNQMYDDTSKDLDISIFPTGSSQKFTDDEMPMPVKIEDVTETIFSDREGKSVERLQVKITLPS